MLAGVKRQCHVSLGRELGQGQEISEDGSVAGMERFCLRRIPVALTRVLQMSH